MKTIIDKIKLEKVNNKLLKQYFNHGEPAVFDIETTGLSPAFAKIILTAILTVEDDNATITQYFAETLDEEKEVIEKTLEHLASSDYFVTYNGRSFDLPFIKQRAIALGIPWELENKFNLDLYVAVKGFSTLDKTLPNLKQKSIEKFMGVASTRDDEISGGESVNMYNEYLRTGNEALKEKILLHNHDDVVQLYKILPVINYIDFHSAMGSMGIISGEFFVTKLRILNNQLILEGRKTTNAQNYICFPSDEIAAHIEMSQSPNKFSVSINAERAQEATYIDLEQLLPNAQKLEKYPSYVNGYLILKNKEVIDYMSINAFIMEFFSYLPEYISRR